jgi:hypothetical protein
MGVREVSDRIYTLDEQIACVRRELAMRINVYPKWVKSGRMKPETADHEINCMQSIHDRLTSPWEMEIEP